MGYGAGSRAEEGCDLELESEDHKWKSIRLEMNSGIHLSSRRRNQLFLLRPFFLQPLFS